MSTGVEASAGQPTIAGVEIRGLRKRYGDTIALDGLDLVAHQGEILGIAGPNGAGKSTIVKILAAETAADSGEIVVDGRPWTPGLGVRLVAVVHQEPQLFPNLTVADNIMIGRENTRFVRPKPTPAEMAVMLDLSIAEMADRPLDTVPLAIQQRTEIARALVQDARVFLFDEPNSALTADESDDLFRRMHALAAAGRVVILVSHRLAELVAHCSRVAVVLDGKLRRVITKDELTQEAIANELVVGHTVAVEETVRQRSGADIRLQLTGWSHRLGEFADIDLHVRAGEIVAIVGVEGSGARELVRSIAGFEPGNGHIVVDGVAGDASVRKGTGFVPADRVESLFANFSVADNLVSRLSREIAGLAGALVRGRMAAISSAASERYQVKAQSLGHPIGSLSGGNQQKIAIAAAMVQRPKVLVLEEPTRGVDVGSKREIYHHLREYAAQGHAVVLYCTEIPEVFEAADRVHVIAAGRISPALEVLTYATVQALAADITKLEKHHSRDPAVAASPA